MEDSSGTADEGSGGVDFIFMDAQVIQADFLKIKAFGLDADRVFAVFGCSSNHIQIDAGSNDASMLMVGVITTDFGASRRTEQSRSVTVWKSFCKQFQKMGVAFPLVSDGIFMIEHGESGIIFTLGNCM